MKVIEKGMKDLSTSFDAIRLQGRLDGIQFCLDALKKSGNISIFLDDAGNEIDRVGKVLSESLEKIKEHLSQ